MVNQNLSAKRLRLEIDDLRLDQGIKIVVFDGFLDKSTVAFAEKEVMKVVVADDFSKLVFDFKQMNYVNSEGIGFLMMVATHLRKNNRDLLLLDLQPQVMDVMDAIGLLAVIKVLKGDEINSI